MNRFKEESYEYILKRKKSYFGPTTCREATYDCRVKKQYMRIMFETNKLKKLFNKVHEKFLKAIDHMKFHPTLGKEKKGTYCTVVTMYRHANMAQSLDGYLWAVSSLKKEKMRIRCLEDSHLEDIKPPLMIVYIGDGCEGYSSNLFIPAKSELTSEDETLIRHVFFLDFNDEYQDLTKYSLIQQLNLPQLTAKELEELPNQLTALQPMTLNHLKERIKPLAKYPFSVHPNVVLIILMASLLPMLASIGFIVW